jgi:hypothetical protein
LKTTNGKKLLGIKLKIDFAYRKKAKKSEQKAIPHKIHGDVTSENIISSDNSYPNTRIKLKHVKKLL